MRLPKYLIKISDKKCEKNGCWEKKSQYKSFQFLIFIKKNMTTGLDND